MRKTVTIILAALLVLSLAACGGGSKDSVSNNAPSPSPSETPSPSPSETPSLSPSETPSLSPSETPSPSPSETPSPSPEPEPEPSEPEIEEIAIGDTITTDLYEFTLVSVEFADKYTEYKMYPDGKTSDGIGEFLPEGNTFIVVDFCFKNVSKNSLPIYCIMELDYNDGFIFNLEKIHYLHDFTYPQNYQAWVSNQDPLPPLNPQVECRRYGYMPIEVKENETAPAKLRITLSGKELVYIMR